MLARRLKGIASALGAVGVVLAATPAGAIVPAPVFSANSACGSAAMVRVFSFTGPTGVTVSASDTAGETVTVSLSGSTPAPTAPWGSAWASFTSAPGNPGTGTVSLNPPNGDIIAVLYAVITQATWNATFVATDSIVPTASSSCSKTIRASIF